MITHKLLKTETYGKHKQYIQGNSYELVSTSKLWLDYIIFQKELQEPSN